MSSSGVSVIVPVFNGNQYLREALDSVFAQSCPPTEVLIVDDGSTDPPDAILAAYASRVRLLRQDNRGPASARNHGITQATTEFVAFIDQDDLWPHDKLERQLACFSADVALDVCFGRVELFWETALKAEEQAYRTHPRGQLVPGYSAPALLARRHAFDRVGLFDADLHFGDAPDWIMRARTAGLRMMMLPDIVLRHRMHASNLTRRRDDSKREFVHIVRTHLKRQRQHEI